ncbi:MAG TPA: hypothetical protein VGA28_07330 [Desulfurivibrionaceae bacterium]|jgi:hypothetical protein
MAEKTLRKYHATLGAILSLFIFIQVGSGTLIAFNEMLGRGRHANTGHAPADLHDEADGHHGDQQHEENLLQIVHHHGTPLFQALRVLFGIGVLTIIISGTIIYAISRTRKKHLPSETL